MTDAPKWFIEDGIGGSGDRPEWLPEKFKTVADMAKSYKSLEERVAKAPDNYDFSKSKFLDGEHAAFKDLQTFAKERRVPAEVMDKMVSSVDTYMSQFDVDKNAEMAKLGENGKERVSTLTNWAKAHLEEPHFNALFSDLNKADSILALESLRKKFMSDTTKIPTGGDVGAAGETAEELQSERTNNLEKYKTDIKYRKEFDARFAKVHSKG